MELRTVFYRHPYAMMVTTVFLVSLLITMLYFFRLIPGVPEARPKLNGLTATTVILLVTTVVSWVTAILVSPDD
jgi:hypothetical protein